MRSRSQESASALYKDPVLRSGMFKFDTHIHLQSEKLSPVSLFLSTLEINESTRTILFQIMSTVSSHNRTDFTNLHSSGSMDELANLLASDAFRDQTHIRVFLDGLRPQASSFPIITHDHLINLHIEARFDPHLVLNAFSVPHLQTIQVMIKYAPPNREAIESALEALFDRTPSLTQVGAEYFGSSMLGWKFCQKIIQREISRAQ
jgi:hypothetical protein